MKVRKGLDIEGGNKDEYVLKIHQKIYSQNKAGQVWNQYLVDKLVNVLGFKQSTVDECVFYRGKTLYVLYTEDSILAGPDSKDIYQIIKDMKKSKLDVTIKGDLQDFLRVNTERKLDWSTHLTQPHLIYQILKYLRLEDGWVTTKPTPASSLVILSRNTESEAHDGSFNYCSIIGKLNYMEQATRRDIS